MIYIRSALIMLTFVLVPFSMGISLKKITGAGKYRTSFARTYVDGFIIWMALYETLEVVAVIAGVSFTVLTWLWIIVTLAGIIYSLTAILQYKAIVEEIKTGAITWSSYKVIAFVLMSIVFVIIVFCGNRSVTDDSFYLGAATDALKSNKIWFYEPYTGRVANRSEVNRYMFSAYPIMVASFSKIYHIPAAVVSHVCMCIVSVIMTYLAYYLVSRTLFKEQWHRWVFIATMCILMLSGNYGTEASATFFMISAWMGKSWLPNVMLPMILYYMTMVVGARKTNISKCNRVGLIMCSIACSHFSSMSTLLVPMFILLIWLYYIVTTKKFKEKLTILISIMPQLIIGMLFIVVK